MAESIEQYYVNQYQNNIRVLSGQMDSRLVMTTIPPVRQTGENLFWERMGHTTAVDLASRHDDTPNIEVDHSRRKQTATPKVWATLLDWQDVNRMIVDPTSYYNQIAVAAMNRAKDDIIIDALGGNAYSGQTGTTAVALPSAQKIAHGGTSMTLSKLLSAKEILDEAEVDESLERYCVLSANQITSLLGTTEIKSSDYNTVKALAAGQIDTFLGFKFIRSQRLDLTSSVRYCYCYAKGAIGYGILDDIQTKIDQRPDKNYAWQVYVKMDIGATRIEEEQVVEIACSES
jgi:hypothetical protein